MGQEQEIRNKQTCSEKIFKNGRTIDERVWHHFPKTFLNRLWNWQFGSIGIGKEWSLNANTGSWRMSYPRSMISSQEMLSCKALNRVNTADVVCLGFSKTFDTVSVSGYLTPQTSWTRSMILSYIEGQFDNIIPLCRTSPAPLHSLLHRDGDRFLMWALYWALI